MSYAKYTGIPGGSGGGGGSGTVTSVGLADSTGLFTITGSPVTTSGTLTLATLQSQAQNTFLAAPSGSSGSPTFRTIVSADLPVGNLTDAGTDGIVITSGTGAVIGSGTSIAQHVADTSHNGYLSSTDWNTFNGKQASGSYITALTGDVAASGPGSVAATLATVNSNVGSFGSSTSIPSFTVNGKGLITAASGNAVVASAGTLSGTTLNSTVVTSSLTSLGTQSSALNMGSHLINNVTNPSSPQDAATKSYVDNAAAGINPAVAVQAATTSAGNTSGFTYNNGVSGIGATFTGSINTAVVIDGYTFTAIGQRLLVKNDTQSPSGAFNGVYYVTQVQTSLLPPILTRSLDYDQPSDMNNTGAIPVINGTVNGTTQWVLSSLVNTVGTDPLIFTQFARNPSDYLLKANNLSDVSSPTTSFNNISPMTTGGDIIYGGASGAATRLANGTAGQVLTSAGGTAAPTWSNSSGGIPGTNWTAYTQTWTGSGGTNPTVTSASIDAPTYRRIGDSIDIAYVLTMISSTDGTGLWLFSIPAGLTIDGSKILIATTRHQANQVGCAQLTYAGSEYTGYLWAYDTTRLGFVFKIASGTEDTFALGNFSFATPGGTQVITFQANVPITQYAF